MSNFYRNRNELKGLKNLALVVCDDSVNTPAYLKALKSHHKLDLMIKNSKGKADPRNVIRTARRWFEEDKTYTGVFCVADKDHYDFGDAKKELMDFQKSYPDKTIKLILSVPCMEIWLLWHFTEINRCLRNADEVCRAFPRELNFNKDRTDYGTFYIEQLSKQNREALAIKRAATYYDDTDQEKNPSTQFHILMNEMGINLN